MLDQKRLRDVEDVARMQGGMRIFLRVRHCIERRRVKGHPDRSCQDRWAVDAAGTAGRRAASRGVCAPEAIFTGLRHSCQRQQERQGSEEHGEAESRTAHHRQVIYTKTEGYLHADVDRLAAVLVRSSPLERRRKKGAVVRPAMAQILGELQELARPRVTNPTWHAAPSRARKRTGLERAGSSGSPARPCLYLPRPGPVGTGRGRGVPLPRTARPEQEKSLCGLSL